MKQLARVATIAITGLALTACGTIVNGSSQKVAISTEPVGAEVVVDGILMGQTPTSVILSRKNSHIVTLRKEGYAPQTLSLGSGFSGWFLGNLLLSPVGFVVDAVTGGGFKLDRDTVTTQLNPEHVVSVKA